MSESLKLSEEDLIPIFPYTTTQTDSFDVYKLSRVIILDDFKTILKASVKKVEVHDG